MYSVLKNFRRYNCAEETEQEINVIKCCLPNSEEETEASDVEMTDDDIDLEELTGALFVDSC